MHSSYVRQYHELWHKHWWWQARHRLVLDKLKLLLPCGKGPRPRLLDIGCGGGLGFDDFQRCADVYGLEPDPFLADSVPHWRSRVEPVPFDAHYLSPRLYDLVLMLDVLEHIHDDAGAVANVGRLLHCGGHLLVTVPALPLLWSRHDEANHHYRRYRLGELRSLLTRQGLEVVEARYLFGWSLGLFVVRRWLCREGPADYKVHIPPAWLNIPCRWLSTMEECLAKMFRAGPPLGSSLLAIARKPARASDSTHPGPTLRQAA